MDILSDLGRGLAADRFTANLIAAHGLVVALVLASLVLRRLLAHGHSRLNRWPGLVKLDGFGKEALRHGHMLLFWLTVAGVVVTLGSAVAYHAVGGDVRSD